MASMQNDNLKKELDFFIDHQKELVEKYEGKFIVIKDQKIEGIFDTEIEAYTETQKRFELGTFIIQECISGKDVYSRTFHSRVIFP